MTRKLRIGFLTLAVSAVGLVAVSTGACSKKTSNAAAEAKVAYAKSYSLGYEFGKNVKVQPVKLDLEAIFAGIEDAWRAKTPKFSEREMKEAIDILKEDVKAAQQAAFLEQSAKSLKEGNAFQAENARKEGVKTLPSGLQYKILREGTGPQPKATDRVTVHYRGTFVDGKEFDSSYSRKEPTTFWVNEIIPGWKEALQLMKTGAKWQLVIPPQLGYGDKPTGRIPANSTLIFEVELLSTEAGPKPQNK